MIGISNHDNFVKKYGILILGESIYKNIIMSVLYTHDEHFETQSKASSRYANKSWAKFKMSKHINQAFQNSQSNELILLYAKVRTMRHPYQ